MCLHYIPFPSMIKSSMCIAATAAAKSCQSCPTCATPETAAQRLWQSQRLRRPWDSPGKSTGVGCHFLLQCMKVKSVSEVAQSCPTLSDPMDYSLPGFSICGISQARILEGVAVPFSRGSTWPRDQTWVSCIAGRFFTVWATGEAPGEFNKGLFTRGGRM